jgi:hypothetical protein
VTVGKSTIARATLIGAFCLPILPVLAQEQEPGGVLLTFGIDQLFETGNNLALDVPEEGQSSFATTYLSFGISSISTTQTLGLDLSGGLQIQNTPDTDGTETSFADPAALFLYELNGADSLLRLRANYSEADIDTLTLSDFVNDEGLIELPEDFATLSGTGTRTSFGGSFLLQTGIDAPLGFNLSAGFSGIDYTGTSDPDLFDFERNDAGAEVLLQFSPVLTGTVGVFYDTYDADNAEQTYRTTTSSQIGAIYEISERATLEASLGYAEVKTEEIGVPDTTTTSPIGSLGFLYDMPNGAITVDFDASVDDDGNERTNLVFGRSIDRPDGAFAYTFGVTDPEQGDLAPIGSLYWLRELPDGAISARFERAVTSSNEDESRLSTLLAFTYDRTINAYSGIGFDIVYGQTDATATENETRQIDVTASYNYALTADWGLNTGIVYQVRDEDNVGWADSPSIFLSIGREFAFRP